MGIEYIGKSVDPTIMSALSANVAASYGVVIDPEVIAQLDLRAPVYQRLMSLGQPVVKNQLAAIYAVLTAASFVSGSNRKASFAAGGDPNDINPTRATYAVAKKSYGASGGLKDVDILASMMPGAAISINSEMFNDDAAMLLSLLTTRTIQGIDYGMINGNSVTDTEDFDGMVTKVVNGVSGFYYDADGDAVSAGLINEHVVKMMASGVYPTAIYCNPIFHQAIVEAYQARTNASIAIMDGGQRSVGVWATSVITPAGELPIISDPRFPITATGAGPYSIQGSIYLAVEFHDGVRILYPEWQVLPTALNLGKVMGRGRATSSEFAVWSHLVLVERSNWWAQGCLANVVATTAQSFATASE